MMSTIFDGVRHKGSAHLFDDLGVKPQLLSCWVFRNESLLAQLIHDDLHPQAIS
jgi:hypothetical protein